MAEQRGVLGFGQASNMSAFAPRAQLTSIVDNWSDYYVARVKAVLDSTCQSSDIWAGIKDGMVELAPFANMPDDIAQLAAETAAKIQSGELHPFQGPIKNQRGEQVVAAGEVLSDEALLSMNWYIEGVDDQLPN